MINATYRKHTLNFKKPSGTSRGILKTKETWFLIIYDDAKQGVGECGMLRGLSIDDRYDYEEKLKWVCKHINLGLKKLFTELYNFPSIQFGLEQAFLSFKSITKFELFPSAFTKGEKAIPINGLVWMGSKTFMKTQIKEKLKAGFLCIKMKIGAIDFESELELLTTIRKEFSSKEIEVRVDANGAFNPKNALEKLKKLATLELHSIEQPIPPKLIEEMAALCEKSPLAIALDEELIGISTFSKKEEIVQTIKPQYLILKPSLLGGFANSKEWIKIAKANHIDWWVTSALESNIGLNAIAQWTFTLNNSMPQGLGTGSLFTNNFTSPLTVKKGELTYNINTNWNFNY